MSKDQLNNQRAKSLNSYLRYKRFNSQIKNYNEIERYKFKAIEQFINKECNPIEQKSIRDYYFSRKILKTISSEIGYSYSYTRQLMHYTRLKIINHVF